MRISFLNLKPTTKTCSTAYIFLCIIYDWMLAHQSVRFLGWVTGFVLDHLVLHRVKVAAFHPQHGAAVGKPKPTTISGLLPQTSNDIQVTFISFNFNNFHFRTGVHALPSVAALGIHVGYNGVVPVRKLLLGWHEEAVDEEPDGNVLHRCGRLGDAHHRRHAPTPFSHTGRTRRQILIEVTTHYIGSMISHLNYPYRGASTPVEVVDPSTL